MMIKIQNGSQKLSFIHTWGQNGETKKVRQSVEHNFLLGPVGPQNYQKTTDFDGGAGDGKKYEFLKTDFTTV